MRWKTYEEELREEADRFRPMSVEERLHAVAEMVQLVFRMLEGQGTLDAKLRSAGRTEEEGRQRLRDWVRRHRV